MTTKPENMEPHATKPVARWIWPVILSAWFVFIVALSQSSMLALVLISIVVFYAVVGIVVGRFANHAPAIFASYSRFCMSRPVHSGLIIGLAVLGLSIGGNSSRRRELAAFNAMSPAQHLSCAKENITSDKSLALRHLRAIHEGTAEYTEAQALLPDADPELARRLEDERIEKRDREEYANRKAAQKEEDDRQAVEAARFKALSPAQHLNAARRALAIGYDHQARIGGDLETAEKHLRAIPIEAPDKKAGEKLQKEITERKNRTAAVWYRAQRKTIASDLDQTFIKAGVNIDSVQAIGKDYTILRINYALCSRVFFDRITPPEAVAGWRSKGFTRVECRAFDETYYLDLR